MYLIMKKAFLDQYFKDLQKHFCLYLYLVFCISRKICKTFLAVIMVLLCFESSINNDTICRKIQKN